MCDMNQDGLEWYQGVFSLEPRWSREPNIDVIRQIARQRLCNSNTAALSVVFYSQGAFNKLYLVSVSQSSNTVPTETGDSTTVSHLQYLFRVSLPVDPFYKTCSEVETINFVAQKTSIPVPKIIAWDANARNELGFEWILMEKMPGETVRKRWRKMDWTAKERLVRQLAGYQAQFFKRRFEGIGSLLASGTSEACASVEGTIRTSSSPPCELNRLVSRVFCWGNNRKYDVPRGPFKSSFGWLHASLQLVLRNQEHTIANTVDEDDVEDAQNAQSLAEELVKVLPSVYRSDPAEKEPSVLFHDDLSMQNILVDEYDNLTAIVDWEFVSAVPLWWACSVPELLDGGTREHKPDMSSYAPDLAPNKGDEGLDNEGVDELYWNHLLDYERGRLRKCFLDEMQMREPEWIRVMENNALEADMGLAIMNADNPWTLKTVKKWLEGFKEGKVESLREALCA